MTIIFYRNNHGVHEVQLEGTSQRIALQPRFLARIAGVSPLATAGICEDITVEMAAELGFTQFPVILDEEVPA
ncbi:hypothetical protein [Paenibacillus sp. OAS669]|uniref:hypothetical protein n=1 Tax=Paenibacillus sp. OAS669 TaxID=2663821 RepID=UPI00178C00B7|nr:hypothetical protein [Paenibacillus sp. OAS669]MBE1443905.1 hypothetical protein [Paenibacillus sp. OAS669]